MNTRSRNPDDFDPREWDAQERARADARAGRVPSADDPQMRDYARIAHALARPLPERLPSNFAFQVAQLAARLPARVQPDLRLERWLVRALVGAMGLGALVSALVFGADVVRALDAGGAGAAGWVLLVAACVLPTFGGEAWRLAKRVE